MKKSKTLRALVLVLLMVVSLMVLAACDNQPAAPAETSGADETPAEPGAFNIAVFVRDAGNPFWQYVLQGARNEARYLGVNVFGFAPMGVWDVEEQVRQIEDAIEAGMDAIAIAVLDAEAAMPALQRAMDAGIPVITFNTIVDMPGIETFVGVDNYAGQTLVAEAVLSDIGYSGNVVIIEGLVAGFANIERTRAIRNVVERHPNVHILTSQVANARRDEAMTVMENILQAHSDIDVVFAHNDATMMGALQAVRAAGREGDMILVGFDGTVEGIEAVRDGHVTYTLDQSPFQQGGFSVRAAYDILNGREVPDRIPTGGTLVSVANAQAILDEFYSR